MITRLALRHSAAADPELQVLYDEILSYGFGIGTPLNFFTAQAGRPDILAATWKLTKTMLVSGQLPASVNQMIALSVSRQNDCRYCAVVHRGALEAAGVERALIVACASDPETTNLPEPHRTIVQFALKSAREPASMTDDDFHALVALGLGSEEIAEVVMMAAFTNFINAWADISGIPLDGRRPSESGP